MQERQAELEHEHGQQAEQAATDCAMLASTVETLKARAEMETAAFHDQLDGLRRSLDDIQEEAADLRRQVCSALSVCTLEGGEEETRKASVATRKASVGTRKQRREAQDGDELDV